MKNKFSPQWNLNPRPPAFAASVLQLNHEGLTLENNNTESNIKHFKSISPQRHQPDTIWHNEETQETLN